MRHLEAQSRGLNNKSPSNERCSLGLSVLVISGLSALSWAVVIFAGVAVSSLLV
jgi:hypothetical protein